MFGSVVPGAHFVDFCLGLPGLNGAGTVVVCTIVVSGVVPEPVAPVVPPIPAGPVVVVVAFDEEEEGISIANDSDFGLYDYVFSGDTARAFRVAKLLRAGHVGINSAQRNHEAAFGGFKMSGVGRDGGDYGLEAYSEMQSIIWTS